jgi:hypothetical protein
LRCLSLFYTFFVDNIYYNNNIDFRTAHAIVKLIIFKL